MERVSRQSKTAALPPSGYGNHPTAIQLIPALYKVLHDIAKRQLLHERSDLTLNATALVHEAYIRLADQTHAHWRNEAHFLATASQTIRRILVDYARAHNRKKRGQGFQRVTLSLIPAPSGSSPVDIVALDDALSRLATESETEARIVELRFFGGLSVMDIAKVLAISDRTVRRHWNFAKAWLFRELGDGENRSNSDAMP